MHNCLFHTSGIWALTRHDISNQQIMVNSSPKEIMNRGKYCSFPFEKADMAAAICTNKWGSKMENNAVAEHGEVPSEMDQPNL